MIRQSIFGVNPAPSKVQLPENQTFEAYPIATQKRLNRESQNLTRRLIKAGPWMNSSIHSTSPLEAGPHIKFTYSQIYYPNVQMISTIFLNWNDHN